MSGVKVTLVPPKGAPLGKCASKSSKQVLTVATNAKGQARLTLCPTQSGTYTLKTQGALAVGSVNVLVKGAAPLPVNSVTIKSPGVGRVHASWNKPIYDGGSPVTSYVVTISAAGKKTITKSLSATLVKGKVKKSPSTILDVSGLSNATTYTVSIKAVSALGSSTTYLTTIPVA